VSGASTPPEGLPGLDPSWSRLVTAPDTDGVSRTWHVLDNRAEATEGTMLCVHGNPTWSFLWRRLVAAGARPERPWRVIAVDQLEMGFSERTGEQHRLADRVAALGDLTDELGLTGPVVTVGHDWGGVVSLGWALDHPDLLAGVVLTNTAVHQPSEDPLPGALRVAMAPGVLPVGTVTTPAFLETTLALAPLLDRGLVADHCGRGYPPRGRPRTTYGRSPGRTMPSLRAAASSVCGSLSARLRASSRLFSFIRPRTSPRRWCDSRSVSRYDRAGLT